VTGGGADERAGSSRRLIADCKNRIARQREIIATAVEKCHDPDVAISSCEDSSASLQAFETHRPFMLDRRKRGRATMTGKNRIMIYGSKDDGAYVIEFWTAEKRGPRDFDTEDRGGVVG
jgi:hypothetical protein